MYFEVRTKRLTVTEKNTYKTVKELRLFNVVSYTEAESSTYKYMEKKFPGEDMRIVKIAESKISQVSPSIKDCDMPLWKVKVNVLHENGNGKIRREPVYILIQGESSKEVVEAAEIIVRTWITPTEIVKVEVTKICEVVKEETPVSAKVEKPKKTKSN